MISKDIQQAAELIKNGKLVSFPTETVYGLGADALNPTAIASVFEVKKRPLSDPLIVHIASEEQLSLLTDDNHQDLTKSLIESFWPGPLTLIFAKSDRVPSLLTSGLSTVAVRMPDHPMALDLINKAGTPIAAPSANLFSQLSPTKPKHVQKHFGKDLFILDGGQCSQGVESTILNITKDTVYCLRPGSLSDEEIIEKLPSSVSYHPYEQNQKTIAPGNLPYHYSPTKPLLIVDKINSIDERIGYLFFKQPSLPKLPQHYCILSKTGDLKVAAQNLYDHLHQLEQASIDKIIVEKVPQSEVGAAIMNRLEKAQAKDDFS